MSLNVKKNAIQVLEEIVDEFLYNLAMEEAFLSTTLNPDAMKTMGNFNYIKMKVKTFCMTKYISKVKRKSTK